MLGAEAERGRPVTAVRQARDSLLPLHLVGIPGLCATSFVISKHGVDSMACSTLEANPITPRNLVCSRCPASAA